MATSSRDSTKRRRAQAGTLIGVRLQPALLTALDAFITKQSKKVSRPEAIRALVAEVLSNGGPTSGELKTALRGLASRAREALDKAADEDHFRGDELYDAVAEADRLLGAAGQH
jgi:hypothetical protein